MKKTIYKYIIQFGDLVAIELPLNSEILTIQFQGLQLCLWALINKQEKEKEIIHLRIYGTGHDVSNSYGKYITTVQNNGHVWHIFNFDAKKEQ